MSTTISQEVKQVINRSPFITEMLIQDVISFSNLAKYIQPKIEERLSKKVNTSAIVMALRRYTEELKEMKDGKRGKGIGYELSMKTNIYDVNLAGNDEFIKKLAVLYERVQLEKGDFLNVTLGSHEISLAISEKYKSITDELIKGETVLHQWSDLVAVTIVFDGDFLETPGLLYLAVRKLAWEEINVFEIVSTMNVLTFVIRREDSIKAYDCLQSFLDDPIMG